MNSYAKKAVIVGGSNGIGLSISKNLIRRGYSVIILDIAEPDASLSLLGNKVQYLFCDLRHYPDALIERLADDDSIEVIMITAGFGRVANFEHLHYAEIQNIFMVNTIAGIKIIRQFYKRIKNKKTFYCGMMGSIAGLVSSPMFSVYAASKAAICRFTESVNIELEKAGISNRILNVSPGSIKGTRFNGSKINNEDFTSGLAENIVEKLFDHTELYIPEYDEIYCDVMQRYHNDSHTFGLSSYEYKKNCGRVYNETRVRIGYLSGTFDLFHVGHLNLLEKAKKECDYLIVGVHPNASHKGKETFIPFEERMRIVGAIRYVDKVVQSCPEDLDAWYLYDYNCLFVGSDYKGTERFNRYEEFFSNKSVEIIYFPYTQTTSSTQIRDKINNDSKKRDKESATE